jgi:hypothetical protein
MGGTSRTLDGIADPGTACPCATPIALGPLTNPGLESSSTRAGPHEVAVVVSAKAGMVPADYAVVFEGRLAALGMSASYTRR